MILKLTETSGKIIYVNTQVIAYFHSSSTGGGSMLQLIPITKYHDRTSDSYLLVKESPDEIFEMSREGYAL